METKKTTTEVKHSSMYENYWKLNKETSHVNVNEDLMKIVFGLLGIKSTVSIQDGFRSQDGKYNGEDIVIMNFKSEDPKDYITINQLLNKWNSESSINESDELEMAMDITFKKEESSMFQMYHEDFDKGLQKFLMDLITLINR